MYEPFFLELLGKPLWVPFPLPHPLWIFRRRQVLGSNWDRKSRSEDFWIFGGIERIGRLNQWTNIFENRRIERSLKLFQDWTIEGEISWFFFPSIFKSSNWCWKSIKNVGILSQKMWKMLISAIFSRSWAEKRPTILEGVKIQKWIRSD